VSATACGASQQLREQRLHVADNARCQLGSYMLVYTAMQAAGASTHAAFLPHHVVMPANVQACAVSTSGKEATFTACGAAASMPRCNQLGDMHVFTALLLVPAGPCSDGCAFADARQSY